MAAQRLEICTHRDYAALQQQVEAMITAHATEEAQEASNEAIHGAQQWAGVVEDAASMADGSAKSKLKAEMVLLAYFGLFDQHRQSAALAAVCPR